MRKKREGFTLTEILVVIIIVGVIAALAVPRYIKSVEIGRAREGRVNLNLIFTSQRLYKLDHGVYFGSGAEAWQVVTGQADCSVCNKRHYYTDDPNAPATRLFDYSITTAAGATFTAQAVRRTNAPGAYPGKWVRIDEDGNITDNYP